MLFEPGVFHSKLLMIHGHRNQVAYVGSANATMAAMSINEEILLRVPGCAAIEYYAERIWAASTPLSQLDDRLTARSLISFFRTGALYFKPTTSLQFTINPFTDLLATLPDVERTKLGTATIPHADQETGIGAFNLRRATGLSDEARDVTDREGMKAGIKPYAVETCLGYWVPRAVDGDLQRMLQKVGEGKRARLLELRRVLEKIGANTLARRYGEYVDAVHRLLIANDVAFDGFLATSRRNPFDSGAFRAFFEGVLARLQNEDYLGRLCLPFVSSVMPELWDDPRAFFEFESSFFEYLEYVAQRPGRKSRVPATIFTRIGFRTGAPGVEQIKTALEKYVATTGWTDKDW